MRIALAICIAPSAPQNVTVLSQGFTSIVLTWTTPQSANGIILNYTVSTYIYRICTLLYCNVRVLNCEKSSFEQAINLLTYIYIHTCVKWTKWAHKVLGFYN